MNVTFVSPPPSMTGGFKVIVTHAESLRRLGHEVRLVLPPPKSILLRHKLKAAATFRGWPPDPRLAPSHLDGSEIPVAMLDTNRPVLGGDVPDSDVVIATWWETAEWVSRFEDRKGAKVYFIQGHEVFPHLPIARVKATYEMPMHKVVVSEWLKRVMRAEYNDTAVDVVPNAVDTTLFRSPRRGKQMRPTVGVLYSTSPFTDSKGLDIALAAIDILRQRIPALRVVSFGSMRPVPQLPLPSGAEFIYLPPQKMIPNIYSQCDVWVVPSRNEGFGLATIEAMACRTPVVATRTGWAADAIRNQSNGALVDIGDIRGLAKSIEWVLCLPDSDWRRVSEAAHSTALENSWQRSAAMFERALWKACFRAKKGQIAGRCATFGSDDAPFGENVR